MAADNGSLMAHGLVHVPVGPVSDVALCGDVGDRLWEVLDVSCPVCVAFLKRRSLVTTVE